MELEQTILLSAFSQATIEDWGNTDLKCEITMI